METKPCVKCGCTERYKPRPGKKLGQCKACSRADAKARRKANPEKERARTKAWREANPEKNRASSSAWQKANLEKTRAKLKAWRKANPEKTRAHVKAYGRTNPEKRAAHDMVGSAVRRGDLPRVSTCSCIDCGIQAAEYHHEDYSKPLEVEPLCKKCHTKRHNPDN